MLHLSTISPEPYIIPRGVVLTTRGHDTRFMLPYSKIQSNQQSLFPSAIRLWNELPTAVVTASTLEGFKDSPPDSCHILDMPVLDVYTTTMALSICR